MTEIFTNSANVAVNNTNSSLISLNDWLVQADQEGGNASLSVLRLSSEPTYIGLFTDQGANVTSHYLERTDSWAGGYVECLGEECPACTAQIERKRFLLLPAVDLTDARVKVLRVPFEKGPGKLLTELVKILHLPNRTEVVTKVTRSKDFRYSVDAHHQAKPNPDVLAAIKRFIDDLNAGAVDLKSVITLLPADEIARHERVAKRLALEGHAS
jgi:hypothetical protein